MSPPGRRPKSDYRNAQHDGDPVSPLSPFNASWPALSALLDEALSLPPAGRAEWLEALAGERAAHREPLRSLLAHQAEVETDDFLRALPALDTARPGAAFNAPAAGRIVDGYRLIAEIGQGGMGTVWLAERADGMISRRVALKLPRIAWGDAFAERLAREREILATLEHAHIARLYDAGVDAQGRPFLAMEHVKGEPIDVHCRHRALSVRERVALLLQVMAAVGHAHARLVVHRDLKPTNILVTADGRVKLLDFGIAKLLEDGLAGNTALSELSGRALTLDYASPEQIAGRPLGTASDVYSAGVVAFEVIAGGRPYRLKRGSVAELEEAIAATLPPLASDVARNRALRGDLDAILNKALKKSPADRYPTMDAFAQDLRHWLAAEPVTARPDRLGYRATKFVLRYRLQVAAGGLVAMALVTGTSLALWQAHEANLQARRAQTEAATAQAVQGFIESVFFANSGNQADPATARETSARELLDRGAERIERELKDAPDAQRRLYRSMQEMYTHMALNDKAAALMRRSLALSEQLYGADSREVAASAAALGKTLLEMNQRDEATALLLRAAKITDGPGRVDPQVALLVDASLAFLFISSDPAQALSWARRGAALAREQPASTDTVGALQMLGEASYQMGELAEAEEALRAAEAKIASKPEAASGALPLVLAALGNVQSKRGHPGQARATLQRALALATRVSDPYTLHLVVHRMLVCKQDNGLYDEGVLQATGAYEWARGAGPDFGAMPVLLAADYAQSLVAFGDPGRALEVLDAFSDRVDALPRDLLGGVLAIRADALVASRRAAQAGPDVQRAVAAIGELGMGVAEVRRVRRRWLLATGDAGRALRDFREETVRSPVGAGPLLGLRRQAEEATLLWAAGHTQEALDVARKVLPQIEASPDRRFARAAEAAVAETLGRALVKQARAAEAVEPLERAAALRRALHDPQNNPQLAQVLLTLAEAREAAGARSVINR